MLSNSQRRDYCCELHKAARSNRARWPNRDDLQRATKGRFKLHSRTVQMIAHQLLDNVETTRKLCREHPGMGVKYPWRTKGYFTLIWPAQAVSIKGNRVILPMGRGRKSIFFKGIDMPDGPGACKIVWRGGHELHVSHACPQMNTDRTDSSAVHACVDPGEIHQCAVATSTGDAPVVSGRGVRALRRQDNKAPGQILRKRSRCKKGSRRYRKLNYTMDKIGGRIERRIRDLKHKGTRKVIAFCEETGVLKLYIGDPDGVQKKRSGRYHNQRMSQWAFGQDIDYLQYKSEIAGIESFTWTERGTSNRCPRCGHTQKVRARGWACLSCGVTGHRDMVGAVNMHPLALTKM